MNRLSRSVSAQLVDARASLVGELVAFANLAVSPFDPKLYIASASNGYVDIGTLSASFDPDVAQFNALMKAVADRVAHCRPNNVVRSKAQNLTYPFLRPSAYFPLDESRANERYLRPFSQSRRIDWCIGVSSKGRPVYIPENWIYRGSSRDSLYYACDSGLAAHSDPLTAIKNATISRIKANACMNTWYKTIHPHALKEASLPELVQPCFERWRLIGRQFMVSQLDSDYGDVYLAMIIGNNYPSFVCGVGATIDGDTNQAILDAVANAESNFGLLSSFNPNDPSANDLRTPLDHASYYAQLKNRDKLEFLFADQRFTEPCPRPVEDFMTLMNRLKLTICWLTSEYETYQVVRVFSPELVPISYGYGLEHSMHPVLSEHGGINLDYKNLPHCFYLP